MITDAQFARLAARTYTDAPTWTGVAREQSFQAVLFQLDGLTVVGPRGSETLLEWAADFLAIPHEDFYHPKLGPMHLGIYLGAMSIYPQVKAAMLAATGKRALVGHSLGGGIGLVLGAELVADGIAIDRIVTFGAPRVGYDQYVKVLATTSTDEYRFGNDQVPQVPGYMEHARSPIRVGIARAGIDGALSCHHLENYVTAVTALDAAAA